MPHVDLSPQEIADLREALPRLDAEIASAQEDQEAGLDMEAVLDRLTRTKRLAEHMLSKYGGGAEPAPVRPRRRRA